MKFLAINNNLDLNTVDDVYALSTDQSYGRVKGQVKGDRFYVSKNQYLNLRSDFPPMIDIAEDGSYLMDSDVDLDFRTRNCVMVSSTMDDSIQFKSAFFIKAILPTDFSGKWMASANNSKSIYLDSSEITDVITLSGILSLNIGEIGYFHHTMGDNVYKIELRYNGQIVSVSRVKSVGQMHNRILNIVMK
jgi:hypothetical protein